MLGEQAPDGLEVRPSVGLGLDSGDQASRKRLALEMNPVKAAHIEAGRDALNGFDRAAEPSADHFRDDPRARGGRVGVLGPRHDSGRA
jgi:hypothetical protein